MGANGLFPPSKRNRRARIHKLERLIKKAKSPEELKKKIALFVLNEGISGRKVREYLKFLKLAGRIDEEITI